MNISELIKETLKKSKVGTGAGGVVENLNDIIAIVTPDPNKHISVIHGRGIETNDFGIWLNKDLVSDLDPMELEFVIKNYLFDYLIDHLKSINGPYLISGGYLKIYSIHKPSFHGTYLGQLYDFNNTLF